MVKKNYLAPEDYPKVFNMYHAEKGSWDEFYKAVTVKDEEGDYTHRPNELQHKWGMSPNAFYRWRKRAWEVADGSA